MRFKNVKRKAKNEALEAAGQSLTNFRARAGYTLQEAAEAIGISASYLSEVENGVKNPGDEILRKLAEIYKIPEHILFEKFGRVPIGVIEELEKNESLRRLLTEIKYSNILKTEEDKQVVIDKVLDYFKELVIEMEEEKYKEQR